MNVHEGHELIYMEKPIWLKFAVQELEDDGLGTVYLKCDYSKPEWDDIEDSRIWCATCRMEVEAEELGAEEWQTGSIGQTYGRDA